MEALKGGKEQIKRNKPKLFIAAYQKKIETNYLMI
jgi:hypothetical protein